MKRVVMPVALVFSTFLRGVGINWRWLDEKVDSWLIGEPW